MQTTTVHGALLDDEYGDEYGDESQEAQPAMSLWQKTQEKTRLFQCFRCCRRRNDADPAILEETVD